jgi:glycosyltransferase involved in cell wall biosynthesis
VKPLVSFVIAVHNGARFLHESLGSAAAQTHRRLEIVVVDDGSTDDSLAVIDSWSARDDRIRVIRTHHAGPQHARNVAVAAARGDFVAHLDHDDVASPTRVTTQLTWMEAHGVDICGSCTRVFDDDDYLGWVPERHDDILRESVFRCAFVHPTVMLPAALAKAHPFNERHRCGGDELPIRLALEHGFRLGNVPQPLIKYRHHATQRCRVEWRAIGSHRREIRRRVFHHLFPEATRADEVAILRVTGPAPFSDPGERDRADVWMARLAATDDPMVRHLMAERWAAANSPRAVHVGDAATRMPVP